MIVRSAVVVVVAFVLLVAGAGQMGPLAARPALADVILPNQKPIDYCFTIANLSSFPDYTVIASLSGSGTTGTTPPSTSQVVKPGVCVPLVRYYYRGHRVLTPTLFAVKTDQLAAGAVPSNPGADSGFLPAQVILHPVYLVERSDPRTSIADVLTITTLDGHTFQVARTGVRYTYARSVTKDYPATNDQPDNTRDLSASFSDYLPPWFATTWYLLLPALAVLAIAAVLLRRRAHG